MEFKLFFFITLIWITGLSALTVVSSKNPVAVGSNVTLSLNDSITITVGSWLYGSGTVLFWYPGDTLTGSNFNEGMSFNNISYALTLTSVTLNRSGLYVLEKLNPPSSKGEFRLEVQEPVSNVSLNVSSTSLVEYNNSVTFTCSARGTPTWFSWQNGSSVVMAGGRVELSNNGQVLAINGITRYDQGPFNCIVSNNISREESTQINLNISYGPSNMTMTVLQEKIAYASGSAISLSCSADSKPAASFYWMYNEVPLNVSGPNLILTNVTQNQTGNYTCVAQNAVTLRYASVTKTIRIIDPITSVVVNPTAGNPKENMNFSVTCDVVGPDDSIHWMKTGMYLLPDYRITFSIDNSTLYFNQLTVNDDGQYQCEASNAVSKMTSQVYNFMVNYGPWNTTITGPAVVAAGSNVTFRCSADSRPQSQFSWYFNGSKVADGSVYVAGALSPNNSGPYTCMAFNDITGSSRNASLKLTVIVPVTTVMVNEGNRQPVFNQSFTLICSASGDVGYIQWIKNNMHLLPNNIISFSNDNSTLNFNQLTFSDDGQYQCEASNAVSKMTSQAYNLMVNYGPWNTTITGPAVVAAGSNVTFRCSADSRPQSQFSWYFNGSKVADGSVYVAGALSPNNSGPYTCMAFNDITGSIRNASLKLTVIVPVTTVMVNEGNRQPVFNQSFTLICSASGDVGYIQWIKNNMHLLPNNIISFSNDNSTLNFNQLTFSDDGQYQCEASNAFSNMTSQAYNLMVNYGPWNTTITGPAVVAAGSNVTFRCSADSRPQSQFSWYFNGSKVADGSVYVTGALSPNNSGPYTCMAFNNITGSSSNASVKLTIKYPPRDVDVYSSQMPILNQSFTLACNYKGDVDSIQWMKNGMYLLPNNSISFSNDNSTLSFKQLTLGDDGQYQCEASNAFSNMTSQAYNLMVNYGPFNTTITGPAISETESIVAFNCSADSHPQSQYIWFFNNSKVAEGPVYMTGALLLNNSGQYTCMAFNNITGSSNNASVTLTVIESVTLNVSSSPLIPLASQDLHLFCNVNGVYSLRWLRNNQNFQPSKTVTVSEDNTTVIFKPLQTTSDNGNYQCVATNILRQHISQPFNLVAKYGPQGVQIFLHPGITTTLTCKALSEPPAVYRWFNENNTVVGNQASVIVPIDSILGRNYTCEAKNPLTNVTVYTSINASSDATVSVQASMLLTALLALLLPVLH